jgi:hypothetical protein
MEHLAGKRPTIPDAVPAPQQPSSGLLAANLPLLPRLVQLPVALNVDFLLTAGEHVLRRDVANRAVQTDVVVMLDVALNQTACIVQRQRRSRPDALSFERFVPTFDFSVRLGIPCSRPDRAKFAST